MPAGKKLTDAMEADIENRFRNPLDIIAAPTCTLELFCAPKLPALKQLCFVYF